MSSYGARTVLKVFFEDILRIRNLFLNLSLGVFIKYIFKSQLIFFRVSKNKQFFKGHICRTNSSWPDAQKKFVEEDCWDTAICWQEISKFKKQVRQPNYSLCYGFKLTNKIVVNTNKCEKPNQNFPLILEWEIT